MPQVVEICTYFSESRCAIVRAPPFFPILSNVKIERVKISRVSGCVERFQFSETLNSALTASKLIWIYRDRPRTATLLGMMMANIDLVLFDNVERGPDGQLACREGGGSLTARLSFIYILVFKTFFLNCPVLSLVASE